MIQRIVCFSFKKNTSADRIEHHHRDFFALSKKIPHIRSYRAGATRPGDFGAPPDYHSLHYCTFASMEDIDAYFNHPAHQEFIRNHQEIWDNVLVINGTIEKQKGEPS